MSRKYFEQMNSDKDDNVYYLVSVNNPEVTSQNPNGRALELRYSVTKNTSIIEKANDYYLAVDQVELPNNDIPLIVFKENYWYVTMQNGGVTDSQPINYIPSQPGNMGIYSIQNFLNMINNAILTASINVGIPAPNIPYIIKSNQRLIIVFPGDDVDTNNWLSSIPANPANWNLYMNWNLYYFFQSIQVYFNNTFSLGLDYRIVVADNRNGNFTSGVGYRMSQEEDLLFLLRDVQQIFITTSSLPINLQYINTNNTQGSDIGLGVVLNLSPLFNSDFGGNFVPYTYQQDYPKLIDLEGYGPINKLDFQVYWVDSSRNIYPIFILPGQSCYIKFAFYRKSLFNQK